MTTAEDLKAQGNKAFSAGQFKEAVDYFSKAIAADPSNHVLYSNRSASYASLKEFEKARADAEKTVELNPKWAKGYSRLGAAHQGLGNLEMAKGAFTKGLELDPSSAALQQGLKDINEQIEASTKDPFRAILNEGIWAKMAANPKLSSYLADPALCNILRAMIANPQMAMQLMQQDQRIMTILLTLMGINVTMNPEEGMGKEGAEAYEASQRARSRSPSPVRQRSPSPAKKQAAQATDEATPMEVEPTEEEKQRAEMLKEKELGNAAYKKRDFDTALEHYAKAWELSNESEITILTNQAAVYFEQAKYDECIKSCEKAVDLGREQRADFKIIARALARIGNAYAKLDNLEEAVKFFNKSLTEHRTPQVLASLQDTEKLIQQRKKEALFNPALADEHRDKGNALFKEQQFAEAVKCYSQAITHNENDPRAYSNRAACYHKLGAIPEALKDCETAISKDPNFVKAYIRKAAIQHLTKEYQKCLETCEKALSIDAEQGGKSAAEIQQQIQKTYIAMNSGSREERLKQAMQDPEIQAILSDPIMNQILQQMQTDPGAAKEHLSNPMIAAKIQKLIAAGVISTR